MAERPKQVHLSLSIEEKKAIQKQAKSMGLSLNAYIRYVLFYKDVS